MQGVARHWRNPVRTRVTPLDSSDALYIVFLAYTVKPMDNVVRFTHAPIVSLTCAFYPRTYCQFNLCENVPITGSACAFVTTAPITR